MRIIFKREMKNSFQPRFEIWTIFLSDTCVSSFWERQIIAKLFWTKDYMFCQPSAVCTSLMFWYSSFSPTHKYRSEVFKYMITIDLAPYYKFQISGGITMRIHLDPFGVYKNLPLLSHKTETKIYQYFT